MNFIAYMFFETPIFHLENLSGRILTLNQCSEQFYKEDLADRISEAILASS